MADVIIETAHPCPLPDDLSYIGFVQPSHFNDAYLVSGGTDNQLLQIDSSSATGASTTSNPRVATVVFPLTAPVSPPNGSWWVEDDGTTVSLKVKRNNGSIVQIDF